LTVVAQFLDDSPQRHSDAENAVAVSHADNRVSPGYREITDPTDVVIAVRELRRTFHLMTQFADVVAEQVDVPMERAAGIRVAAALVARLIRHAESRLQTLARTSSAATGNED